MEAPLARGAKGVRCRDREEGLIGGLADDQHTSGRRSRVGPERRDAVMLERSLLAVGLLGAVLASPAQAAEPLGWEQALAEARGQTVYWNAWAGDERINGYIAWVGERVEADYGIELRHVKLTDTAEAVNRVLAEKAAGKDEGGSVDLVWINGENFATMKENGLLYGPFVDRLPNFALVDTREKPTTVVDFTVPVEGLEAPWGMARINFIYDSARV